MLLAIGQLQVASRQLPVKQIQKIISNTDSPWDQYY